MSNESDDRFAKISQSLDRMKELGSVMNAEYLSMVSKNIRLGNALLFAITALEKISDPRKRDHQEGDAYTQLGCVMNIANEALKSINAEITPSSPLLKQH